MNESEFRNQLLALYNILQDHVKLTQKLESAVEKLVERDPDLKAHYDSLRLAEEQKATDQGGDAEPSNTANILLQIQRKISALGKQRR
jgi:hypothetical protein